MYVVSGFSRTVELALGFTSGSTQAGDQAARHYEAFLPSTRSTMVVARASASRSSTTDSTSTKPITHTTDKFGSTQRLFPTGDKQQFIPFADELRQVGVSALVGNLFVNPDQFVFRPKVDLNAPPRAPANDAHARAKQQPQPVLRRPRVDISWERLGGGPGGPGFRERPDH